MISVGQIKAARALLGWKQIELAEAAGLSLTAVNHLECGIGLPRTDTFAAIQFALENGGIEFTEGDGLRRRGEILDVQKHEGAGFIRKLTDDLLEVLKGPKNEVLMCGIDERRFVEFDEPQVDRYVREAKTRKFRERILSREGDDYFASAPECYRWIPARLFGKMPYLVYGDRVAIMFWNTPQRCLIIRNGSLADTFRQQFDYLWEIATPHGLRVSARKKK